MHSTPWRCSWPSGTLAEAHASTGRTAAIAFSTWMYRAFQAVSYQQPLAYKHAVISAGVCVAFTSAKSMQIHSDIMECMVLCAMR